MEQENNSPHPGEEQQPAQQQQQPQAADGHPQEGHAGQGSESAMKQLRAWEQRRAAISGGKRRNGPN